MAVVVAGTIQGKAGKPGKAGKAGKAGKTGPGQTKPRLGTTGKPAKTKQTIRSTSVCWQNQVLRIIVLGLYFQPLIEQRKLHICVHALFFRY